MSVIERTTNVQPLERAVFVTDDDRRARRLRRGAFAAIALACLWLVGLGVGMFGFGSLPGISLITPGHDGKQGADTPAQQQAGGDARLRQWIEQRRLAARQAQMHRTARASALQQRAAATKTAPRFRPVAPSAATPAVAPPAQQPVNPAQRERGWARNGQLAPPGQLRTQPPPPATSRGQRRGQQTTTTTTTTPLPPGQAKKTLG
jgi:ADP-ribose pyrophosphatase YjhB (NUDIX family)